MKIMLDAGHGYNTVGKRSIDGMREYEFNRIAAAFAKTMLEDYENVTVYFAHSDARDVPLEERTNLANRLKADVYVAIHANAYGTTWNDANGIETYVYLAKQPEALDLAGKVQQRLISLTGLANRGVKAADFHVLRETKMTSILVECGFMTNKHEAALLRTESFRRTCARGIVQGIAQHYHLVQKIGTPLKSEDTFRIQAGAFSVKANADALADRLTSFGYAAVVHSDSGLYKVSAGSFPTRPTAEASAARLKTKGINAIVTGPVPGA